MADFKTWAIVQLFGHQVIAGEVSEQVIAGQGFVRVDVPTVDSQQAYSEFYGPNAIYSITPTDEATARAAAKSLHRPPVELWRLNLPEIPEHSKAFTFEEH
jgi:hypothetical protein